MAVTAKHAVGRRARGAVLVEYAFLLLAVAVPAMAGFVAGGAALLREYRVARDAVVEATP